MGRGEIGQHSTLDLEQELPKQFPLQKKQSRHPFKMLVSLCLTTGVPQDLYLVIEGSQVTPELRCTRRAL